MTDATRRRTTAWLAGLIGLSVSSSAVAQPAPAPGMVFTDDLAPVEQITNSMVLNFLLTGKVENLQ